MGKEYYTIPEIMELTGKSKSTIWRAINELNIHPTAKHKNSNVYSKDSVSQITNNLIFDGSNPFQNSVKPDSDPCQTEVNPDSSRFNPDSPPVQDSVKPDSSPAHSGSIEKDYIEQLKKELEVKNQQINDLQRLLDQSQQLQLIAQNRIKELESPKAPIVEESESPMEPPQAQPQNKTGFFRRFFGGK